MGFDASEFVEVAEDLCTSPQAGQQGYLRTAVGRSYYGAYGTLRRRIIEQVGDCFGRSGWHGTIIKICTKRGAPKKLYKVGKKLERLKDWRTQADYKWNATSDIEYVDAENSIDDARSTIEKIWQLGESELRYIHGGIKLARNQRRPPP